MADFRRPFNIYTGYLVYSLKKRPHIYCREKPLAFFKFEEDAYKCYSDKRKFKIVPVTRGKLVKILMSGFG